MANESNTIRIKVAADFKEFASQGQNLEKYVGELTNKIKDLDKAALNLDKAFSQGIMSDSAAKSSLSDLVSKFKVLNSTVVSFKNMMSSTDSADFNSKINSNKQAIDNLLTSFNKLKEVFKGTEATPVSLNSLREEFNSLGETVNRISNEFKASTEREEEAIRNFVESAEWDALSERLSNIDSSAFEEAIQAYGDELLGVTEEAEKTSGIFDMLGESLDDIAGGFAKSLLNINPLTEALKITKQYFMLCYKEGDKFFKSLESGVKKTISFVNKLVTGFKDLVFSIYESIKKADDLGDAFSKITFGDLVLADVIADGIKNLAGVVSDFLKESVKDGASFEASLRRINDLFGESADVIKSYAESSANFLGISKKAYLAAASETGAFLSGFIRDQKVMATTANALTMAIKDLQAKYSDLTIDEVTTKVISGLRGQTRAIDDLGIYMKNVDLQDWIDKNGQLVQDLDLTGKKFKDLNSEMQQLVRTYYIIDKVVKNGTAGYAQRMLNTFNGQVSVLRANLENLKTLLGTLLTQVLVPVIQLLNVIIARVVNLVQALGKLFGLKDSFNLGVTGAEDFADAYKGAEDAAKGLIGSEEDLGEELGKTAKQAKKALAPFHKLNILQKKEDKDSDKSKDAGKGIEDFSIQIPELNLEDMYDPSKIGENFWKDLVDNLKLALFNADWEGVGALLADALRELVTTFDNWWVNEFGPKLKALGTNLGRIMNGFIGEMFKVNPKTLLNGWQEVGKTMSDVLNDVVQAYLNFTQKVDWRSLGEGIGDLAVEFVKDTNWNNVGKAMSEKYRIMIEATRGFFDSLDKTVKTGAGKVMTGWQLLGHAAADFANGFLNNIPWEQLGIVVARGLNGIADALIQFNTEFDLSEITLRIANGFNLFTTVLDPQKIIDAVNGTITNILNGINNFLDADKFAAFGAKIGKILSDTLSHAFSGLGTTIGKLFNSLNELLFGFLQKFSWADLGAGISEGILHIFDEINFDVLASNAYNLLDGIVTMLSTAIDNIWNHKEEILDGLHTVLVKIAEWLHDEENQSKVVEGIQKVIDMVVEFLRDNEGIITDITRALGTIVDNLHLADLFKEIDFWELMFGGLKFEVGKKMIFEKIAGALSLLFDNLGKFAEQLLAGRVMPIVDRLTMLFDFIGRAAGKIGFDGISNGLESAADSLHSFSNAVGDWAYNVGEESTKASASVNSLKDEIANSSAASQAEIETWSKSYSTIDEASERTVNAIREQSLTAQEIYNELRRTMGDAFTNIDVDAETFVNLLTTDLEELGKSGIQLKDLMVDSHGNIIDSTGKMVQSYDDMTKYITDRNKELEDSGIKASDTIVDFGDAANSAKGLFDGFTGSVEGSSNAVSASSEDFDKLKNSYTELNGVLAGDTGLSTNLSNVSQSFTDLSQVSVDTQPIVNGLANISGMSITLSDNMKSLLETIIQFAGTSKEEFLNSISEVISSLDNFDKKISTVTNSSLTALTTFKDNFKSIFEEMKTSAEDMFNSLSDGSKSGMNNFMQTVGNACNNVIKMLQDTISEIDKVFWEITDEDGNTKKVKALVNTYSPQKITIPKLAKGGVINPNQQFLAVLGDQRKGVNIETPLSTMIDAFTTALGSMNSNIGNGDIVIPVYIGDELFDERVVQANQIVAYRSNR